MTVMEPVNLFADEWDGGRDRPGWKWRRLDVGGRLGAELLGASLFSKHRRLLVREDAGVDYFDGEE